MPVNCLFTQLFVYILLSRSSRKSRNLADGCRLPYKLIFSHFTMSKLQDQMSSQGRGLLYGIFKLSKKILQHFESSQFTLLDSSYMIMVYLRLSCRNKEQLLSHACYVFAVKPHAWIACDIQKNSKQILSSEVRRQTILIFSSIYNLST